MALKVKGEKGKSEMLPFYQDKKKDWFSPLIFEVKSSLFLRAAVRFLLLKKSRFLKISSLYPLQSPKATPQGKKRPMGQPSAIVLQGVFS